MSATLQNIPKKLLHYICYLSGDKNIYFVSNAILKKMVSGHRCLIDDIGGSVVPYSIMDNTKQVIPLMKRAVYKKNWPILYAGITHPHMTQDVATYFICLSGVDVPHEVLINMVALLGNLTADNLALLYCFVIYSKRDACKAWLDRNYKGAQPWYKESRRDTFGQAKKLMSLIAYTRLGSVKRSGVINLLNKCEMTTAFESICAVNKKLAAPLAKFSRFYKYHTYSDDVIKNIIDIILESQELSVVGSFLANTFMSLPHNMKKIIRDDIKNRCRYDMYWQPCLSLIMQ